MFVIYDANFPRKNDFLRNNSHEAIFKLDYEYKLDLMSFRLCKKCCTDTFNTPNP